MHLICNLKFYHHTRKNRTLPYLSQLNPVDHIYIPLDQNYFPIYACVSQSIFSSQVFGLKFYSHFLALLNHATFSSPTSSYKGRSLDQEL